MSPNCPPFLPLQKFISVVSFNNPDKGAVAHAIVHRAVWEYLAAVSELEDEAEAEKLRRELYETLVASFSDVLAFALIAIYV